ncbi:hypothetical protein [Flavobacterium litorale]|uniref:DUF4369 domain-containing protein n=1 Tax=Flavobacterium litorale TaxID=2856519 RepID=A0ABX8VC31_9FLAO|nr:hypothetical protein [Flavobacterium litorale]QYJ68586.1 hypothetical protein K1I41_01530 [Flavobacterium litorale]
MNRQLLLYILLFPIITWAQERVLLQGRVMVNENAISNIYVINTTAGEETRSAIGGSFSIAAQPGDRLVFYSPTIITREFILREEAFSESPFVVTVTPQAYELNEVVIDKYGAIDEESLGLVPKNQKRYTPAERRLKTAGDFNPTIFIGAIGGAMSLDPIINAISGRTKMLKKELKTERKDRLLVLAENLFDNEQQIATAYNIPKEYVKGFLYHSIEDRDFAQALNDRNDAQAKFLLNILAEKYMESLNEKE